MVNLCSGEAQSHLSLSTAADDMCRHNNHRTVCQYSLHRSKVKFGKHSFHLNNLFLLHKSLLYLHKFSSFRNFQWERNTNICRESIKCFTNFVDSHLGYFFLQFSIKHSVIMRLSTSLWLLILVHPDGDLEVKQQIRMRERMAMCSKPSYYVNPGQTFAFVNQTKFYKLFTVDKNKQE